LSQSGAEKRQLILIDLAQGSYPIPFLPEQLTNLLLLLSGETRTASNQLILLSDCVKLIKECALDGIKKCMADLTKEKRDPLLKNIINELIKQKEYLLAYKLLKPYLSDVDCKQLFPKLIEALINENRSTEIVQLLDNQPKDYELPKSVEVKLKRYLDRMTDHVEGTKISVSLGEPTLAISHARRSGDPQLLKDTMDDVISMLIGDNDEMIMELLMEVEGLSRFDASERLALLYDTDSDDQAFGS
jgi:hypothetical protein